MELSQGLSTTSSSGDTLPNEDFIKGGIDKVYTSWPKELELPDKTLVSTYIGNIYTMSPHMELLGDRMFEIASNGERLCVFAIDKGTVVDFAVMHDFIAVATARPAAIHLLSPKKDPNGGMTHVIHMRRPLESEDPQWSTELESSHISLGNFGSNLLILWYTEGTGPVFVGMLSPRAIFEFPTKPLVTHDVYGRQRLFIREEDEEVLAVPHIPGQFGNIAVTSPRGVKFYTLKPYYVMQHFTDDMANNALFYNILDRPLQGAYPDRIQFDGWNMLVQIKDHHITMKYELAMTAKEYTQDWIRFELNGQPVTPGSLLYLQPVGTDQNLKITALRDMTDLVIHADLPVTIRKWDDVPTEVVSEYLARGVLKGESLDLKLKPMNVVTPWTLARLIEKYNIKIRAEIWSAQ